MMKVKVFDESHEKDLEEAINKFISEEEPEIMDIKFSTAVAMFSEEQIFCFSALIVYR
ncbi:MAG TPA: sporulation protein Cse60 [Candidatus Coprosoma intestinipullorum]|uniref:Sporulation protein Cse60 n=1 Tax=Candidatus Coprosoma intestinipullorum TaxID=2840752 RepID=A0A9D0ZRR3_9FIRM|nr:sporulation protein Cse60 [Candidatus Coprosoma intestinipullorum]